ncbi:MAG: 3-isopropylmalate dehydratase, partial [Ramlibacter sp.]|nr:3-isopropylmalate dehydratase [Ramlibacter sp.]
LHRVFMDAGFDWRTPGCSMCLSANGDMIGRGERALSTANRNFANRQGPGSRTHIAGPVLAAASALAGCIADPRRVGAERFDKLGTAPVQAQAIVATRRDAA